RDGEEAVPVPAPGPQADDEDRDARPVSRPARGCRGDRADRRGRRELGPRLPHAREVTLQAYCWPPSAGRGEQVGLFVSTDAPTFDVAVVRESAEGGPIWSGASIGGRSHDTPDDASS